MGRGISSAGGFRGAEGRLDMADETVEPRSKAMACDVGVGLEAVGESLPSIPRGDGERGVGGSYMSMGSMKCPLLGRLLERLLESVSMGEQSESGADDLRAAKSFNADEEGESPLERGMVVMLGALDFSEAFFVEDLSPAFMGDFLDSKD
jgi:hypothetical protein